MFVKPFCLFLLWILYFCIVFCQPANAKSFKFQYVLGNPISRTSVLVKWGGNRRLRKSGSYIIQYGFDEPSSNISMIEMNSRASNVTIQNLQFHANYKIRVGVKEVRLDSFSGWTTVSLDVETYILRVQLPSETKSLFQKALHDVFPLSYLNSKELNSTSIDLDTSMVEVFYDVFFKSRVGFTSDQLTDMFARNHARAETSFVRNVKVYSSHFCQSGRHDCSRFADCTETSGSYSCACNDGYVDLKVLSYKFSGRSCAQNTAKPDELNVNVINSTAVSLEFISPRNSLGNVIRYEVGCKIISGEKLTECDFNFVSTDVNVKHVVAGLSQNQLYQFRVRAITSQAPGLWSSWKTIRLVFSLMWLNFDFNLYEEITNYQLVQAAVHSELRNKVKSAFIGSSTLSMLDYQIFRSDLVSNETLRVQSYLYMESKSTFNLDRMERSASGRFRKRFVSQLGRVIQDTTDFEDVDECETRLDDCDGNNCENLIGSFRCNCPTGLADISDDLELLPGRQCIVFDLPLAFSVSLLNPITALLSWKIPTQLRKPRLHFWFELEYKQQHNATILETQIYLENEDFSAENYVVSTTIGDLRMTTVYQFRVSVANNENVGRFTNWETLHTSSLIFNAKLNLTLIVFSKQLTNQNHDYRSETADLVRNLLNRILNRMPQYSEAGNITFIPGIRGRTYANAYLFFNKNGNVQVQHVEETFKHNSVFDEQLGLDFQTVSVTDVNECESHWNDCSENANCTNDIGTFSCNCENDYIDLSKTQHLAKGRICIHESSTTTPAPTTSTEPLPTTRPVLQFPKIILTGYVLSPSAIRIHWHRNSKNQQSIDNLNYDLQYRIKGFEEWMNITVAAQSSSLDIVDLYRGGLYQFRIAERWQGNAEQHTLFSFPIEVRTDPRAYRIFTHLSEVAATSDVLSGIDNEQILQLKGFIIDYLTKIFNHPDVKNKHSTVRFSSIKNVSFSRHPDRGLIVSAVAYFASTSRETLAMLNSGFRTGENLVEKPFDINFMYIADLNECLQDMLNDCSPTSYCTNKVGTYVCTCNEGLNDIGPSFFLLPGRLCQFPINPENTKSKKAIETSTTSNIIGSDQLSSDLRSTSIRPKPTLVSQRNSSTTAVSQSLTPVNMIGLTSGVCNNGQRLIHSICQDVLLFVGKISILKESGHKVTKNNLLGNGYAALKQAVEEGLHTAFLDLDQLNGYQKIKVQVLLTEQNVIWSIFIIVFNSETLRFRRQATFILDDYQKVNPNSIRTSLWNYLNGKFPIGIVRPKSGAEIIFGINGLIISDIDECSLTRSIHDCDTFYAFCRNNPGGFECACKNGTIDTSADTAARPGRRCQEQCRPSPCMNGGRCKVQPHVGAPLCKCTKGYSGSICSQVTQDGTNRIVIALATVGGVIFFLILFITLRCLHKKKKDRKEAIARLNSECLVPNSDLRASNDCSNGTLNETLNISPTLATYGCASNDEQAGIALPPPIPTRAISKPNCEAQSNPSQNGHSAVPLNSTQESRLPSSAQRPLHHFNYASRQHGTDENIIPISVFPLPANIGKKSNKIKKTSAIKGRIRKHSDESS